MAPRDSKVHVARNGSLVGTYDFDQLGDLVERGQLQQSDHYFDEAKGEWVVIADRAESRPGKEFRPAQERPLDEEKKSGSRRHGGSRSARARKANQSAVFGWIACLFALGVAAGIWAYAGILQDRIKALESKVSGMEAAEAALRRENQLMSELTPAGRIRAIITYEPTPSQIAIMSGATVGLYRREDVEAALRNAGPLAAAGTPEEFDQGVESLKNAIPSPLSITLTDSNGRVDLSLPGAGDYVLVASAGKLVNGTTERMLWLMGIRATGEPSPLVLLTERNAVTLRKPTFRIVDVPATVSGTSPAP